MISRMCPPRVCGSSGLLRHEAEYDGPKQRLTPDLRSTAPCAGDFPTSALFLVLTSFSKSGWHLGIDCTDIDHPTGIGHSGRAVPLLCQAIVVVDQRQHVADGDLLDGPDSHAQSRAQLFDCIEHLIGTRSAVCVAVRHLCEFVGVDLRPVIPFSVLFVISSPSAPGSAFPSARHTC